MLQSIFTIMVNVLLEYIRSLILIVSALILWIVNDFGTDAVLTGTH